MEVLISLYESLSRHIKNTTLVEAMEMIANGKVKNDVEQARAYLEKGDKGMYDKVKKKLPGITFAGTFKGRRKSDYLDTYSKLVILDLDHIEGDPQILKKTAAGDSNTLAAFVSPSNDGIKILVKVNSDKEHHKVALDQVADHYERLLDTPVDRSGKDLARLCFLSFDPDIYVNYDSQVFEVDIKVGSADKLQKSVRLFKEADKLTQRSRTFKEGERNEYVHLLAHNCNRTGIPIEVARQLILKAYLYDAGEENTTIDSAYNHSEEHGVGLDTGEQQSRLQRVEDYLDQHYDFRMNIASGNLEYRKVGKSSYKPITDYVENSIFRALEREGLGTSSNKLATLLRSDFAERFDPFAVYLENLPEWDGNDHIGNIVITVSTTNDHYWKWIFEKWFVTMVASLIKENVVNHGVLVFVGAQGVGKTTWIERLVPPELKDFLYSGTINAGNKDTLVNLSECMLINMDELENLNRSEIGDLKQLITKLSIRVRKAYGRNNESLIRRASFAGSVNNPNFLNDPTGSRRFLVAEVVSIDLDAKVDLNQVYAQALKLFKEGYRYWFNKEENAKITAENVVYQAQSIEEEMIQTWFQPGSRNNYTHVLTATEIGNMIAEKSKYQLLQNSPVKIGKILSKLGYWRGKYNGIYKYPVRLKEYSDVETTQRGVSVGQTIDPY